jgi:pantoate--beta-alanine ligase
MKVFYQINDIRASISDFNNSKLTIGFVPTMGALHEAHLSIVKRAKQENSLSVCSIFINPIQFNNKEDFVHYPRNLDSDIRLLESVGCDILFAPSEEEVYPEPDKSIYDLGGLDKSMEGLYRPGHFNGVATIVKKLIDIVTPDKVYFGEKDFQQLAIMKYFVKKNKIPVEIISFETMREPDGLAMSSRNVRLNPKERQVAPLIYKVLLKAKKMAAKNEPLIIKKWVRKEINNCPLMKLEYFEIVDMETLEPVKIFNYPGKCVACIAVYLGNVRLIDNIFFS